MNKDKRLSSRYYIVPSSADGLDDHEKRFNNDKTKALIECDCDNTPEILSDYESYTWIEILEYLKDNSDKWESKDE